MRYAAQSPELDRTLDVVRDRLLTATHLARLCPGRRVPSVRRMAQLTGLDRRAVHRAYRKLAAEGFLETRPGCGTFLSEEITPGSQHIPTAKLLAAVERCLADAADLGLSPVAFGQVLAILVGDGLRGYPVAVAECNHEQIGLIALEVRAALGVVVHPLMLREVGGDPGGVLHRVRAVIGTSCHREEVLALAAPFGLPVHWVAQDPEMAAPFLRRAAEGRVVMVVRDRQFARGFLRLLAELRAPDEIVARFEVVEPADACEALRRLGEHDSVYVSPLVPLDRISPLLDPRRRVPPPPYLDRRSLERLRVHLAMDIVRERSHCREAEGAAAGRTSPATPVVGAVGR